MQGGKYEASMIGFGSRRRIEITSYYDHGGCVVVAAESRVCEVINDVVVVSSRVIGLVVPAAVLCRK